MLSLILGESAIELVPNENEGQPGIIKCAKRKKKDRRHLILDQNYHHSAILRLGKSGVGRGRPDIVHFPFCSRSALPSMQIINSTVSSTPATTMLSRSTRAHALRETPTGS